MEQFFELWPIPPHPRQNVSCGHDDDEWSARRAQFKHRLHPEVDDTDEGVREGIAAPDNGDAVDDDGNADPEFGGKSTVSGVMSPLVLSMTVAESDTTADHDFPNVGSDAERD